MPRQIIICIFISFLSTAYCQKINNQNFHIIVNEGSIQLLNSQEKEVGRLLCQDKRSIRYQDNRWIIVVSTEKLISFGDALLQPVYQIDLFLGSMKIIDYATANMVVSNNKEYLLYSYIPDKSDIEHLRLKKIGNNDFIWDIKASQFNGVTNSKDSFSSFIVWTAKQSNQDCTVVLKNETYDDIYLVISFKDFSYKSVIKK